VPDRAGMTIFFAPAAEKLGLIRTAEDLFGLAGYRAGSDRRTRSWIGFAARRARPRWSSRRWRRGLRFAGTRAGRRLKFRVIARMAGEHEYRRVDFQRAVERGILERAITPGGLKKRTPTSSCGRR